MFIALASDVSPLHATRESSQVYWSERRRARMLLLLTAPQLAAAPQSRACLSRRAMTASVLCCSSLALPRATAIPSEEDVRQSEAFEARRAFELKACHYVEKVGAATTCYTADPLLRHASAL